MAIYMQVSEFESTARCTTDCSWCSLFLPPTPSFPTIFRTEHKLCTRYYKYIFLQLSVKLQHPSTSVLKPRLEKVPVTIVWAWCSSIIKQASYPCRGRTSIIQILNFVDRASQYIYLSN